MNYKGIIIEESLLDTSPLKDIEIIKTEVEPVTEEDSTPWIKQWTMHTVEVPENMVEDIVEKISKALEPEHYWYADFKNEDWHYIIFRNKIFKINRHNPEEYQKPIDYGKSFGIPEHQLDFSPQII